MASNPIQQQFYQNKVVNTSQSQINVFKKDKFLSHYFQTPNRSSKPDNNFKQNQQQLKKQNLKFAPSHLTNVKNATSKSHKTNFNGLFHQQNTQNKLRQISNTLEHQQDPYLVKINQQTSDEIQQHMNNNFAFKNKMYSSQGMVGQRKQVVQQQTLAAFQYKNQFQQSSVGATSSTLPNSRPSASKGSWNQQQLFLRQQLKQNLDNQRQASLTGQQNMLRRNTFQYHNNSSENMANNVSAMTTMTKMNFGNSQSKLVDSLVNRSADNMEMKQFSRDQFQKLVQAKPYDEHKLDRNNTTFNHYNTASNLSNRDNFPTPMTYKQLDKFKVQINENMNITATSGFHRERIDSQESQPQTTSQGGYVQIGNKYFLINQSSDNINNPSQLKLFLSQKGTNEVFEGFKTFKYNETHADQHLKTQNKFSLQNYEMAQSKSMLSTNCMKQIFPSNYNDSDTDPLSKKYSTMHALQQQNCQEVLSKGSHKTKSLIHLHKSKGSMKNMVKILPNGQRKKNTDAMSSKRLDDFIKFNILPQNNQESLGSATEDQALVPATREFTVDAVVVDQADLSLPQIKNVVQFAFKCVHKVFEQKYRHFQAKILNYLTCTCCRASSDGVDTGSQEQCQVEYIFTSRGHMVSHFSQILQEQQFLILSSSNQVCSLDFKQMARKKAKWEQTRLIAMQTNHQLAELDHANASAAQLDCSRIDNADLLKPPKQIVVIDFGFIKQIVSNQSMVNFLYNMQKRLQKKMELRRQIARKSKFLVGGTKSSSPVSESLYKTKKPLLHDKDLTPVKSRANHENNSDKSDLKSRSNSEFDDEKASSVASLQNYTDLTALKKRAESMVIQERTSILKNLTYKFTDEKTYPFNEPESKAQAEHSKQGSSLSKLSDNPDFVNKDEFALLKQKQEQLLESVKLGKELVKHEYKKQNQEDQHQIQQHRKNSSYFKESQKLLKEQNQDLRDAKRSIENTQRDDCVEGKVKKVVRHGDKFDYHTKQIRSRIMSVAKEDQIQVKSRQDTGETSRTANDEFNFINGVRSYRHIGEFMQQKSSALNQTSEQMKKYQQMINESGQKQTPEIVQIEMTDDGTQRNMFESILDSQSQGLQNEYDDHRLESLHKQAQAVLQNTLDTIQQSSTDQQQFQTQNDLNIVENSIERSNTINTQDQLKSIIDHKTGEESELENVIDDILEQQARRKKKTKTKKMRDFYDKLCSQRKKIHDEMEEMREKFQIDYQNDLDVQTISQMIKDKVYKDRFENKRLSNAFTIPESRKIVFKKLHNIENQVTSNEKRNNKANQQNLKVSLKMLKVKEYDGKHRSNTVENQLNKCSSEEFLKKGKVIFQNKMESITKFKNLNKPLLERGNSKESLQLDQINTSNQQGFNLSAKKVQHIKQKVNTQNNVQRHGQKPQGKTADLLKHVKDYRSQESKHINRNVLFSEYDKRHPKKMLIKQIMTQRDFIRQNAYNSIGQQAALQAIMKQNFNLLFEMNLPILQQETKFTREELFRMYSQFLSMFSIQQTEVSKLQSKEIKDMDHVDIQTYKSNVTMIKQETKDVQDKIIQLIQQNCGEGGKNQITWQAHLNALRMLLARSLSEKIEQFISNYSHGTNNYFTNKHVKEMCKSFLETMFNKSDDLCDQLASFFCKLIYQIVELDETDYIPIPVFRYAITQTKGEESELLLMLVGGDQINHQPPVPRSCY